MRRRAVEVALFLIVAAFTSTVAASDDFDAWILNAGQVRTLGHPPSTSLPVGSIQKPFLTRAWALSHPNAATPRFTCTSTSGCWRPSGHGTLDLRGAIRESCNTYFKTMARETPRESLRVAFQEAGFTWKGDMTDGEAIGLPGPADVRIEPRRLMDAYTDLVRTPWAARDDVRNELLSGLRDSANDGTASGLRLRGFLAKTGTVPSLDGAPLKTSGFAIVVDDAGFALLGLLRRGTGREAAIRAGVEIAKVRPGSLTRPTPTQVSSRAPSRPGTRTHRAIEDPVRVQMLDELRLKSARLKNVGNGPIDSSRGFVGAGASLDAVSGDRFGSGDWLIQSAKPPFERRLRASIDISEARGVLRFMATMAARDYANGVLKAELTTVTPSLRAPLAASVLRFLSRGARHQESDVCDSTHCAWFVGDGPVPRWLRPDRATMESSVSANLTDAEWRDALRSAREEPREADQWTADCGGDPVSPHFIWGNGDKRVTACPRHAKGRGTVWRREWKSADLAAAFGARPAAMEVTVVDGQWMLSVRTGASTRSFSYDDAHRRLADTSLGWDAMPAPASRVSRTSSGFVAEGVGLGHRVGLCLAP